MQDATAAPPDAPHPPACRLWVGTSGYSYTEWADAGVYPAGTLPGRTLPVYARTFGVVELNYTWYQMPKAQALARMAEQVSSEFRFTAKLTRSLTHEVDAARWRSEAARYREGVAVLLRSGQLLAVLVQLPPSFERVSSNRSYLAALLDELQGLPLAVEFRHRSWAHDRVFAELERRHITLVNVDSPALPALFPRTHIVTCPTLFYVRLHGRNARGWRSGNMQQQFDYCYTENELAEWINPVTQMAGRARRGVIFFNNHVRGQAVHNARNLRSGLEKRGLTPI